jgi:hypothetical protein
MPRRQRGARRRLEGFHVGQGGGKEFLDRINRIYKMGEGRF